MRIMPAIGLALGAIGAALATVTTASMTFHIAKTALSMEPGEADRLSLFVLAIGAALSVAGLCLLAAIFDMRASLRAIADRARRE